MQRIAYVLLIILLICLAPAKPVDFTAVYHGVQALLDGVSPYDQSITDLNQLSTYGRLALPDEDQMRIAHPLTSLLLLLPIGLLPLKLATVLYCVGSLVLLCAALVRLGAPWWWAALLVLLLREPLASFFLGQIALLAAAATAWAVVALKEKRYGLAQACFVAASVHPVLTIPLALIVLPKRGLYLAIMISAGLVSLLIEPLWALRWLETVRMYPAYVDYMVWLPSITPIVVPVGFVLLFLTEYKSILSGLVLLLPITGMYHMALFAPVFIKPTRIALLLIAILWAVSFMEPSMKKAITPLTFVGAALSLEYRFNQKTLPVMQQSD